MEQIEKRTLFEQLHSPSDPLVLYNIWDAGGATAITAAGARAIATGSWSVAAAHGYDDGENIPFDLLVTIVERIALSVALPVSVDFEGGFADSAAGLAENAKALWDVGAVGVNFEDRLIHGNGVHSVDEQQQRIKTIKQATPDLFVNARTDLFLQATDPASHPALVESAIERAQAYVDAGADSFFAPGLVDPESIRALCASAPRPVNIMMAPDAPPLAVLAELGVARISYGGQPYRAAIDDLKRRYSEAVSKR